MNKKLLPYLQKNVQATVKQALLEDVGEDVKTGDISALLIDAKAQGRARVISRERAIIAGRPWVDEVFRQVDASLNVHWRVSEGQWVRPNQVLFEVQGLSRSILTAERSALNFLQTLSACATVCKEYVSLVAGTGVTLLDTRKTLPSLRYAQKYACTQGGVKNHRMGLYDAFLIKENHIMAAGSIAQAISKAREIKQGVVVEVEVENTNELEQAIKAHADIIMLDNFSLEEMEQAVAKVRAYKAHEIKLEASGDITKARITDVAKTGVDYISIGALTKHCKATDLSMRFTS